MSTVLYITAHPLSETKSSSLAVGKAFIEAYRRHHPDDEIAHIDLYKTEIPHIDADVFSAWEKLGAGERWERLTASERDKVSTLNGLADQFVAYDKYVFVTPMWNFSYPPVVKAYIDAVAVAGKTFKYTANGSVGLLTGKKALHIQSRGGVYSEGEAVLQESGHRHLAVVLGFMGVPAVEGLFVEGHNQFPERAGSLKHNAVARAKELAAEF